MRTAFIETLSELAASDPRIMLVCGDLGYSVLDGFANRFPDRFLNAGVAEQNMIGVAAGLAQTGRTVYVYSIANFPIMRCFEQLRNDIAYHNLNVKIVAVGGGLVYGGHGYTHHGVEDLAVMRVLPNMTVLAPGDPVEGRWATKATAHVPGPCYLRLGRANEPVVHHESATFSLGKVASLRPGTDVTLVSTGGMLYTAVKVAESLAPKLSVEVLSMHTIHPVDKAGLLAAAYKTGHLVSLEEHAAGGLGTVIAEVLAETASGVKFLPLRLQREPSTIAGSQASLRASHALSPELIAKNVTAFVSKGACNEETLTL